MDALLVSLIGETLVEVSLQKYPPVGLEAVILHMASGRAIKVCAKELDAQPDVYSLELEELSDVVSGIQRVQCNFAVGKVDVVQRDEWDEPIQASAAATVGNNPRLHASGKIGSAPPHAMNVATATCGVVLCSPLNQKLLVCTADFPELVEFTKNDIEIVKFQEAFTAREVHAPH
jgi:hypothetical protein